MNKVVLSTSGATESHMRRGGNQVGRIGYGFDQKNYQVMGWIRVDFVQVRLG
jgi:hypothetical protein